MAPNTVTVPPHRKLVFFIIDGCSSFYLDEVEDLPGLGHMAKHGVRAEYSQPIFPTLSLPNFYSMFTGLYAEEHGMFSNQMYDPDLKEKFYVRMKENRDRWFEEAPEPLWAKTGRLGIRTCLYWPWFVNFHSPYSTGPNVHYGEDYDTFVKKQTGDKAEFENWTNEKLTDIVERLKDPCSQFMVVYWGSLDETSHNFGPRSVEAIDELKRADDFLMKLQKQLDLNDLASEVDILVAADHGQMLAPKENHIHMHEHLSTMVGNGDIEAWCEGDAYMLIYPAPGKEDQVYQNLTDAKIAHARVVKNEDLPDRFRVKNARRAPAIWLLAEPGYSLVDGRSTAHKDHLGVHGYDDECEGMRGICLGRGPGFERQPAPMTGEPVKTKDYYSIMCKCLDIEA